MTDLRLWFWLHCMDAAHRVTGWSRLYYWCVEMASDCVDYDEHPGRDCRPDLARGQEHAKEEKP